MACRTCHYFEPERTAAGRIRNLAGRCGFTVQLPPLPAVIDPERAARAVECRNSAWPNDGDGCPTYEEIT